MKLLTTILLSLTAVWLFSACTPPQMPDGQTWTGTFSLSTKGDQAAEAVFEFDNNSGMLRMPDLIPIPLMLSEVRKDGDSVFFTVGFRSGPAMCRAGLEGDTLRGWMTKAGMETSPFWLASGEPTESIFGRPKPAADEPVVIRTHSQSPTELATAAQLKDLFERYDLEPYLYTKEILVQDSTIPHSHPVLTVSTRDTTPELLLSTLLHEQMHWYTLSKSEACIPIHAELKAMYPTVPIDLPEGGGSEKGTRIHLLVNYFELHTLQQVIGPEKTQEVLEHWKTQHYTWIYETVEKDWETIERLVEAEGLHFAPPAS